LDLRASVYEPSRDDGFPRVMSLGRGLVGSSQATLRVANRWWTAFVTLFSYFCNARAKKMPKGVGMDIGFMLLRAGTWF